MSKFKIKRHLLHRLKGASLLELIMYSALVSIILGIFFFSTTSYISSSERDRERAAVDSSQLFLEQKIHSLLNGAGSSTLIPFTGASGSTLGVRQANGSYLVIYLNQAKVYYATGTDGNNDGIIDTYTGAVPLTNSHITVTSFVFNRQTTNSQTSITVQATVQGKFKTSQLIKTEYIK